MSLFLLYYILFGSPVIVIQVTKFILQYVLLKESNLQMIIERHIDGYGPILTVMKEFFLGGIMDIRSHQWVEEVVWQMEIQIISRILVLSE